MILNDLLAKLKKAKRQSDGSYLTLCPAHPDKNPSLHITEAEDRLLLKCHAGCSTESICVALNITVTDLFTKSNNTKKEKVIVATYDYKDEAGNLLYQVVRFLPKSFAQRHKNGQGEWVWDMEGVRRVLYHLPDVLLADSVYHVEGEKDADNLIAWGQIATTSPGGANAWKPEYANYLNGKRVVLIPHKDSAGYNYAKAVAKSLQGKAREIKCIILPGDDVKDFTDWIDKGNDIQELPLLEQDISILLDSDKVAYRQDDDTIIWQKNLKGQRIVFKAESVRQERTGIHARISISSEGQPLSWSFFNIERSEDRTRLSNQAFGGLKIEDYSKEDLRRDLDIFCAGLWDFNVSRFIPELMKGEEAQEAPSFFLYPYIIESGGSILFAPPGRGKSHTALLWAQSINSGVSKLFKVKKAPVLYINLERSDQSLKRRLANVNIILGLPADTPLLTLNARGKSLADIAPAVRKSVTQFGVQLIILDSISRAGYGDLTENRPVNAIIDALSALCETWLALGHTPRASEEHLFGSVMADAGADIVIHLRSQVNENTLGIGYEITKSNDLPQFDQKIFAFVFNDWRLIDVRQANPFEFPDIMAKAKGNMLSEIEEFILNQDSADATATEIENATGHTRTNISRFLNQSGKFVKTRKVKQSQFFGVAQ